MIFQHNKTMAFYKALSMLEKGHSIQCVEFPTIIIKPNQLQKFKHSNFKNLPCMWTIYSTLTLEERKELKKILSLRKVLKIDNIVISGNHEHIHLFKGTQTQLIIKTYLDYAKLQADEEYTPEQIRYMLNE